MTLLLAGCLLADAAAAAAEQRQLAVGLRRRAYVLHRPPSAHPPAPLVIVLHGHGGTADLARRITGFDAVADRAGFLVAYPEGTGWHGLRPRGWSAGNCCGYPEAAQVDDVAFLRAVIADVVARDQADPARVYVVGMSNGAMMAYRMACEATDVLAAVASVAGTLAVPACTPTQPVGILAFHGTADGHVPYAGGQGPRTRDTRQDRSVDETIGFWREHNGCAEEPERGRLGDTRWETFSCRGGSRVALYTVEGGGHAWPGGRRAWRFGDPPTRDVSASEVAWMFFAAHTRRGAPGDRR